jgi:uncharacterized repeat protein (TIGR01451 family)
MTIARHLRRVALAAVALSSVGVFQAASALPGETTAGADITNTATVSYTVGTVVQTPLNSNTVTFEVDRKVDFTVSDGSPTTTNPGTNNVAVGFTVSNTGNDADSYTLSPSNPSGSGDDFDVSGFELYLDDGDNTFDAGDTLISAPLPLARDTSATVFVVADIPLAATDGQNSIVRLTATTSYTATSGAETANVVDVVFADAGRDGIENDDNSYVIESADLEITKAAEVISDPINLGVDPKAIPGAVIEYTITIENNGSEDATDVTVADAIPANTTYVAGSLTPAGTENGSPVTDVAVTLPTVAAGATANVTFRVTIQ